MMQLDYESEALQEVFDAAEWYSLRADGLRNRFLKQWKGAETRLIANPERYPCFEEDLRKCRFENFPYLMIYRIEEDRVRIYAVMHTSRRPGYWKDRI
jgi:toxin ParE1/3/4